MVLNPGFRCPRLLSWLAVMWLVTIPWATAAQQPPDWAQPDQVARSESAEAQLQHAAEAHAASRGRKGPRRLQLLYQAIACYRAVQQFWPEDKAECAVAGFRRGEIHRALEESGAARGAFEEVLEAAPRSHDLHIRALLELGHLDRRDRRWHDAVGWYQRAVDCEQASLCYRNDAREWIVKVHLGTMAWASAEAAVARWLPYCEGPVEEIKAIDLQFLARIGGRHFRAVVKGMEALRKRMEVLAGAPTAEGRRVRRALDSMKAPAALLLARQNGR
jgi:tetratricopeptide (TPR) repeat protein